jgi:hypothetical protein
MKTALSPIESEFATTEEAEAYERCFRAKVLIDTKRREYAARTLAN